MDTRLGVVSDPEARTGLAKVQEANGAVNGIDVRKGAEPLIEGTTVEVYRIAALIEGGMTVAEVLHDYPGLSAGQVEDAVRYSKAHPEERRPYPARTAKSALRASRGGLRRAFAAADG